MNYLLDRFPRINLGLRATTRTLPTRLVAALALLATVGCANYQAGSGSLYAPDVHTVYVPMIESESFRRDLGERLTEAVCKEIELKTPYKVVGDPSADSVLNILLLNDSRRVVAEDGLDQARYLENQLRAEVNWINRRRLPLAPVGTIVVPGELIDVQQTSLLTPAAGQTVASQQQLAIQRMAERIVGLMEEPW